MSKKLERKDCFFGLHLDLHPRKEDIALGADITEENIKKLLMRTKPEHVAYDCKGHEGYAGYPTEVGTSSPEIVKDSLAIWRKVTREMGVLLGIHYSGVWDFLQVKEHPEWARVDENGGKDTQATSTFGPYVDELLIPQLKEIITKYKVDSVWLDGECWGTAIDYSPAALKAWHEETGHADAPKSKDDPGWFEWKMFQRRHFEKYLCHWIDEIHKFKDGLQAASNWAYTTMMPKQPVAKVDFLSGDFDPFLSVDRARTEVRYLTNTGIPWELQSWGFDLVEEQDECLKLPAQLKQEAGVVMMHGGGYMIYFPPTRSGYINDTIIDTAGEVADFCHERKELCFKSTSVPQIAVLYSARTQFDLSDRVYTWWGTPLNDIEGVLHALLELHYSVDIMAEFMLEKRIKEFPLLVIPDSYKLTHEFIHIVINYVKEGGNLLLLGCKAAKLFKENLGVEFEGEPGNVNATLAHQGNKVSVRGNWQDIKVIDAQILAYRYNADGAQNRSSYMDIRDEGVSEVHAKTVHKKVAATLKKLGKGKIAAVYGPICNMYFHNHHPYMRKFIGEIVEQLFPEPLVKVNAPSYVDMSLRRTSMGDLSIHLLNLANLPVSERRAFLEYVAKIHSIGVELKTVVKPKEVIWEPYGEILSWSWDNGVLTTTVPVLGIHGVIVIKI